MGKRDFKKQPSPDFEDIENLSREEARDRQVKIIMVS
jgi:hypothetical protein